MTKKTKLPRPTGGMLLIRPDPQETTSKGGIILPESTRENSMRATVVAVGPGSWEAGHRAPVEVEVGDRIIYSGGRYGGSTEMEIDGVKYELLAASTVMAVLS